MRATFSAFIQCVLFLATFLLGSFLRPFNLQTTLAGDATHTRLFIWDGLLLTLLLYVLVLALEAALKKVRTSALTSTIAVILATILGLVMKFGFITTDR